MSSKPTLRPYEPGDHDAAAATLAACLQETFAPLIPAEALAALTLERARSRFGDPATGRTWLFDDGGQIVGLGQIEGDEISFLYLRQSHHGRGLGRALISALCAAGRAAGHQRLRLWCLTGNRRARLFYDRLGTPTGHTKDIVLNDVPLPHLEYEIRAERA